MNAIITNVNVPKVAKFQPLLFSPYTIIGFSYIFWAVFTSHCADATTIFVCGPLAMIRAVQERVRGLGRNNQASLEAHMACGSGSCHGCVIDTPGGLMRVCSEGPVIALDSVVIP